MKPHQYSLLAALMAHSNMGLDKREPSRMVKEDILSDKPWILRMTVESAVCHLSQSWIESDEIEQTFYEEARGWEKKLKNMGIVQIFKSWPWLSDVVSPRDLEPDFDAMLEKEEARLCS